MRRFVANLLCLCIAVACVGVSGCSSDGDGTPEALTGNLSVRIDWPGRTRYVPPYANSVVLELTITQTGEVRALTVNRAANDAPHTGQVTFPGPILVGSHVLRLQAYEGPNGTGELVATGSRVVTIVAKRTTTLNVSADLQSTVSAVFIDNAPTTFQAGNQTTLIGHAEDANGQTLMLPPGALRWAISSGQAFATIDPVTGLFQAIAAGEVTVLLSEPGAGVEDTADITIIAPPPPGFGNVAISVDWPGRSRYVPPYANSLVATIGTESITINRQGDGPSTGSRHFPNPFPVSGNPYTLQLEAYTLVDGEGTKVATASLSINVIDGETLSLNISGDLESVIDRIVIEGPLTVQVNETVQMIGHARDASDTIILLPAGALQWSQVSGAEFGTITSSGEFQGISPGVARVRLEEPGAGVFAEADVTVVGEPPPAPVYKLVFVRDELGDPEVYFMNSDGTGLRNLSNWSELDEKPEFDATGSRVIYASTRDEGEFTDIYIINSNGTNRRRLTDSSGPDTDPAISPDGSKYVFTSRRNGNTDLYIGDTAGLEQNIVQITDDPAIESNPVFSPDGELVLFTSDVNGTKDLFVYEVDTQTVTPIITGSGEDYDGRFSPDGTKIVFVSDRDGNPEIYVFDRNLMTTTRLTFNTAADERPAFTHDGLRIVFMSDRTGNQEVFIMNANGTAATNLTTNTNDDVDPHTPRLP
jgi:hypothetical protein